MKSIKDDICEDVRNTWLTIEFELEKHFKRKRVIISFSLAVILPLIFYVVPKIWADFPDTAERFASLNLEFVSLLIIIAGSLFAGDAVSGEFEEKTGLLLFPTPQRHMTIFIGKYIGALIPTMLVVSIYYLTVTGEVVGIYGLGALNLDFLKSFLVALIYSTSAVSVVFLFSSILQRKITSTLLGFFSLMMILPIISNVLQFLVETEPWYIVTYSAGLITDVFSATTQVGGGPGGGITRFSPDFYTGLGVMFAYTIGLFFVGLWISIERRME
ncbi:MAG: ABC transporter permease [Candidatus Thermoplasmatota archaeon]|nr:ABC transporter permease [Candidatus Thermoplasmatota archaeon]